MDGGDGNNTLDYCKASAAVQLNLLTEDASGGDAAGDSNRCRRPLGFAAMRHAPDLSHSACMCRPAGARETVTHRDTIERPLRSMNTPHLQQRDTVPAVRGRAANSTAARAAADALPSAQLSITPAA